MQDKVYTPGYFFMSALLLIFLAEILVMLLLPALPELPYYSEAVLDASILCIIVIPMLYIILFKPMDMYVQERDKAQEELQQAHYGLERRVTARTDELKHANETLQKEIIDHKSTRARMDHLLDVSPAVVYTSKPEGEYPVTFISENIRDQLSYEPREFMSDPAFWVNGIHQDDRERVLAERPELLKQGYYVHEYRFKHKDGSYRWMHDKLRLVKDEVGDPYEIVGSWIDITGRVQLEEELKETATTDKLTDTYNRAKFEEIISIEMERSKRYSHPLSMVIFDVDKFKEINDSHGHLEGDKALKKVADIARGHMRRINHLIRWGGDEFIILPVETELKGAFVLAERVRESIASYDFGVSGKITVSIGIAMHRDGDTEDSFIKRADDALYRAKEMGGNRVEREEPV